MTIDIDNFYWVAVASWGGKERMAVMHCDDDSPSIKVPEMAAEMVREAIIEHHGAGMGVMAKTQPVGLYVVEHEDINEVTLRGPQLMVRGQPVSLVNMKIVNLKSKG